MNDADTSLIVGLVEFDEQRPGLPAEHWLTFDVGPYLLLNPRRTAPSRLASMAADMLFVGRALTGREGAIAALGRMAEQQGDVDFVEVAAPWPALRSAAARIILPGSGRLSRRGVYGRANHAASLATDMQVPHCLDTTPSPSWMSVLNATRVTSTNSYLRIGVEQET